MTNLKNYYKSLPLQKKLFYSYSIPIIFICTVICIASYPVFSSCYKKQFRNIQTQSCVQATNFISQYITNMYYISQLMENNAAVISIISKEALSDTRPLDNQYREFWKLNTELQKISVANSIYRIGIYIPDKLIYANNNYYFYPVSTLKKRSDYSLIKQKLLNGKKLFVSLPEISSYNPSINIAKHISLLGTILPANKNLQPLITKVEISVSEFEKILQKVNMTNRGLVYLIDGNGRFIASSNETEYIKLQKKGSLPITNSSSWIIKKISGNGNNYVLSYDIQKYGWKVFCLIPVSEYWKQSNVLVFIILLILILLAGAVFAISYILSSFYTKRLTVLSKNMDELGRGKFKIFDFDTSLQSGDEIDGIYRNFNIMAKELQRLMEEHYKQGKSVVTAELRALQSQINPHFLYNTLDLINWEAMKYKAGNISFIAQNLGQFYRLCLNHGNAAVLIKKELEHVESYVNIENAHFDDAVHLEFIVPEKIQEYACLGIILQPFVENSIMHGIAENSDIQECYICISAEFDNNDIIFDIRDNGPGISQKRKKQILNNTFSNKKIGYGVQNINSRLRLCYGESYGVSFDSIEGKGTTVHIKIPAFTLEQLEHRLQ